jgi:DNA-binding response OmpR family regulator
MRTQSTNRKMPDRAAFAVTHSRVSKPRPASIHAADSSVGPGQRQGHIRSAQTSPTLRSQMTDFLVEIDELPVVVRLLVNELLAEMQRSAVSKGANIHALLSSTLEKMADRMRGSSLRSDDPSIQPPAMAAALPSERPALTLRTLPNETVLRVGALELDLIDRSAKRGDREIDLRPREFQLLKYMMQRSDQLLTRASLFKEVWHYKFVPESNLVDVHMGRLRRKIDAPNESPVIRNIRGVGFILSATSVPQGSTRWVPEALPN